MKEEAGLGSSWALTVVQEAQGMQLWPLPQEGIHAVTPDRPGSWSWSRIRLLFEGSRGRKESAPSCGEGPWGSLCSVQFS